MKERAKSIALWIILFVAVTVIGNVIYLSIQTVSFYTFKTNDGTELVFGYNGGITWLFSRENFSIDNDNNITLTRKNDTILTGVILDKASLESIENVFQGNDARELQTVSRKKIRYTVYEYDGIHYCIGYFEKYDQLGYFLQSNDDMDDENAIKTFSRFQGTKGIGYYLAKFDD